MKFESKVFWTVMLPQQFHSTDIRQTIKVMTLKKNSIPDKNSTFLVEKIVYWHYFSLA